MIGKEYSGQTERIRLPLVTKMILLAGSNIKGCTGVRLFDFVGTTDEFPSKPAIWIHYAIQNPNLASLSTRYLHWGLHCE